MASSVQAPPGSGDGREPAGLDVAGRLCGRLPAPEGRPRGWMRLVALAGVLVVVIVAGVVLGSVRLPLADVVRALFGRPTPPGDWAIIHEVRLPRTITATFCGAALGVAGLQMQTLFRNPLADPFVLGISSGASLGVAVVVLLAGSAEAEVFGSGLGLVGDLTTVTAACIGAAVVMTCVLAAGRVVRSSNTLLLLGVMLSYLVSAGVTVLLAGASPQRVQQYVEWGFGSFEGVTWPDLHVLVPVLGLSLIACTASIKPLNALLLGERYAATMGVRVRQARVFLIASSSVLAGTVTAFAGPIAFLGIAIPHVARSVLRTSDHRLLVPGCILIGASMALAADVLAQLPGQDILPLNAVNAVLGAPVVVIVLIRASRRSAQL
jgi:iron complex transport system permease protein